MSTASQDDLRREVAAKLRELPPADWVTAMIDHYHRHGWYRPEDLRRLLGDPNRSVVAGPDASLASFLSRSADA
jgi:hypothetical protein